MLVGPSGVTAGSMDDPEDCIRSDEIPRINRCATLANRVALILGIDGQNSAIDSGKRSTVQLGLIEIDTFVKLRGCSHRRSIDRAVSTSYTIAYRNRRRIERSIKTKSNIA